MSTTASKPIEILEPYEIAAMCEEVAATESITGIRDAALISFLYNSGLRISEALAVTPNDLTHRDGVLVVNVKRGKGGRQGWSVVMPDKGQLAHWMAVRAGLDVKPTDPIFCTISRGEKKTPGTRQDRKTVAARLKSIASRAGITKRVHCHGFRHSHAVALYANGAPMSTIQDQLRHAHPMTTQRYLRDLGCVDSARVLAGLKWG